MSAVQQPLPPNIEEFADVPHRQDVEIKQQRIATLLDEWDCEALLVTDPVNVSWLTSGGVSRGLSCRDELPALFYTAQQRWVICNNVDSLRFFDEEIHGLGFQLKEWPWYGDRDTLLNDMTRNRKIATDRPFRNFALVQERLQAERRFFSEYEQFRFIKLGKWIGHALEATSRNFEAGQSEEEVAGQLGHRLLHHGIEPMNIVVAADDRSRAYRRLGYSDEVIRSHVVLQVTGYREGLYATASRSTSLAGVEEGFLSDFETASRVSAIYQAGTVPNASVGALLETVKRFLQASDAEHEWRAVPPGYRSGREPAECLLTSQGDERLLPGQVITWQVRIGAASVCDTFLVTDQGSRWITTLDQWPIRRVRIQSIPHERPDLLIRGKPA